MSKEILMVVDAVSNEKGVDKDIIFEAIEAALASATRRRHGEDIDVRVAIDRETGEYDTFRRWLVFEDESTELEVPDRELRMIDAVDIDENAEPEGFVEVPMDSVEFGRIAAQTAKQVIVQKVREAEREQVVEEYKDREGELLSGIVKRVDRNGVYIDLGGNAEGFVARDQMVPREPVRPQDRMKALLTEVRSEQRGPQLFMTRTSPQFLVELFKIEVPEVGQGLIDILGAARDPGLRAKIAVRSNDARIDPVGACVGMRGSRVQAVSNELAGERVDIILWDENPAQFVVNAMSPAEVVSIVVDEDAHSMDIAVDEEKLSQAIGRGGQNIRLASELSQWELNVMTETDAEEKSESEMRELIELFSSKLDVDEEVALILVQEGFSTIEEEFDEDIVNELRNRARDLLLTQAIVQEEKIDEAEPAEDLLSLEGMNKGLAFKLASEGVVTREDLAELATDDLLEINEMDSEEAAALIMKARAHWFETEQQA
jgi:N utilization substance protein A